MCLAVLLTLMAELLPPGDHRRTLTVDERERYYLIHIPKTKAPLAGWPVVLAFHGGGSSPEGMVEFSGLNEKADTSGFVVVYPGGTGRLKQALTFNGGNCCGYAQRQEVDDVKFVAALLDDLEKAIQVDKRRIFSTGMSNGGIISYLIADKLSARIAAIAPVGGPMGAAACSPGRAVSVCHMHGTDDEFAPYRGGRGARSLTQTDFYSVDHSISAWVKANGCQSPPKVERRKPSVDDGTHVTKAVYPGGRDGSEVVLYTVHGAGHTWPGRPSKFAFLGKTTANLSANDVMWEFFTRHPLPERQ